MQPFQGTTFGQDIDVISTWYQLQLDIGAEPTVVIHSGWTSWGSFPEVFLDGFSHCTAVYRNAIKLRLETDFPGIQVLFTRSSDMLFQIHQDGFDLRTTMGRDFIHLDLNHGREMMNQLVRYTIGQPVTMTVTQGGNLNDYLTGVLQQMVFKGDLNFDSELDLRDVLPFVDTIIDGAQTPAADINRDGVVDLRDVDPFVTLIISEL